MDYEKDVTLYMAQNPKFAGMDEYSIYNEMARLGRWRNIPADHRDRILQMIVTLKQSPLLVAAAAATIKE